MTSLESANYFYQPEVFFSRSIWEAAGSQVRRHLYHAMDYDLWLRMAAAGASVYHIPQILVCSRVHADQKTQDNREYLHQIRQIMDEYLAICTHLKDVDIFREDGEFL